MDAWIILSPILKAIFYAIRLFRQLGGNIWECGSRLLIQPALCQAPYSGATGLL